LENAVKIVKNCVRKYRIPEPIRMAHIAANKMKRAFDVSSKSAEIS